MMAFGAALDPFAPTHGGPMHNPFGQYRDTGVIERRPESADADGHDRYRRRALESALAARAAPRAWPIKAISLRTGLMLMLLTLVCGNVRADGAAAASMLRPAPDTGGSAVSVLLSKPGFQPVPMQDDDLYQCPEQRGTARAYLSERRAFLEKHGAASDGLGYFTAEVVQSPKPEYPPGWEPRGDFISLLVAVSATGKPIDYLVECSSESRLEDPVLKAVRAATYKVAKRDQVAVSGVARVAYLFEYDPTPPPPEDLP